MNVLIVHNSYGKRSGEEVVVEQLCDSLRASNVSVFEMVVPFSASPCTLPQKIMSSLTGIYNLASAWRMIRAIRRQKIDLIHIHNVYPWLSFSVMDAAQILGVPVVITVHNYRLICPSATLFFKDRVYLDGLKNYGWSTVKDNFQGDIFKSIGYWLRFLQFKLFRYETRIDGFFFLSQFQLDLYNTHSKIPSNKCHLIGNPLIFSSKIESDSLQAKDNSAKTTILFVGRVEQSKGAHLAIDAATQLADKWPDVKFIFAGGYDKQESRIKSAPDNCEFLGLVDRDKLFELMNSAKVTLSPSLVYETFGMSFLEAAYYGNFVITTNSGGLKQLAQGLYGVTAISPEPENMAKAIDEALNTQVDAAQLIKRQAHIKASYDTKTWIEKQKAIYAQLTK